MPSPSTAWDAFCPKTFKPPGPEGLVYVDLTVRSRVTASSSASALAASTSTSTCVVCLSFSSGSISSWRLWCRRRCRRWGCRVPFRCREPTASAARLTSRRLAQGFGDAVGDLAGLGKDVDVDAWRCWPWVTSRFGFFFGFLVPQAFRGRPSVGPCGGPVGGPVGGPGGRALSARCGHVAETFVLNGFWASAVRASCRFRRPRFPAARRATVPFAAGPLSYPPALSPRCAASAAAGTKDWCGARGWGGETHRSLIRG